MNREEIVRDLRDMLITQADRAKYYDLLKYMRHIPPCVGGADQSCACGKTPTYCNFDGLLDELGADGVPDNPTYVGTIQNALSQLSSDAKTIEELRAEVARLTRERDEWHGRAAESAKLRRERDEALAGLDAAVWRAGGLQARLDALMLEFCPDEMTDAQRAERAANQVRVDPDTETAINNSVAGSMRDGEPTLGIRARPDDPAPQSSQSGEKHG